MQMDEKKEEPSHPQNPKKTENKVYLLGFGW
jgi:hypothetical protein